MQGIRNIMLTAERLSADYESLNTDVIVQFDNGDRYVATFFSCKYLESILQDLTQSADMVSTHYYKVLNIVLVRDFNKQSLTAVIESMLAEGDFQLVFRKI